MRAEIFGVRITDSSIGGDSNVGAIVASATYTNIYNCQNHSEVFAVNSSAWQYAGGIAGILSEGSIIYESYNLGNVKSSTEVQNCQVGGIVGIAYDSTYIYRCFNLGTIIGTGSSNCRVGGIVGCAYETKCVNCYNAGTLSSEQYANGIAGLAIGSDTSISRCFNIGNGGITSTSFNMSIVNCFYLYNSTQIRAHTSRLGTWSASIEDAKQLSWYSDSRWNASSPWNFDITWTFIEGVNGGYPVLRSIHAPETLLSWTDGFYADSFADGDGTEDNPYLISSAEELARLAYLINNPNTNDSYKDLYYKQTQNIDVSGYWWNAIGEYDTTISSASYEFSGNYDGGGYTVSGIRTYTNESYQGLFGYVRGVSSSNYAEIHDVGVVDSEIIGGSFTAAIVGYARYANIYNCYNTCEVHGGAGVVGSGIYMNIYNCYNTGNIFGTSGITGGGGNYSTVFNCYNTGNITATGSSVSGVGNAAVYYSFNTGDVIGSSINSVTSGPAGISTASAYYSFNSGNVTGGYSVAGVTNGSQAYNCYNLGDVSGTELVGGVAKESRVHNSYNLGNVDGVEYVGGIHCGAKTSNGASANLYNSFNIGNVSGTSDVGGLWGKGFMFSTEVYNSFNAGDVNGQGPDQLTGSGTPVDCDIFNAEDAKNEDWYKGDKWHADYAWDFDYIWEIDGVRNNGYPYLTLYMFYYPNFEGEYQTVTNKYIVGEWQPIYFEQEDLFVREGYDFIGWNTAPDGSGMAFEAGVAYSGTYHDTPYVPLYAQWEPKTFKITLDKNGGTGGDDAIWLKYGVGYYNNSKCTGEAITIVENLPSKNAYSFLGYFPNLISEYMLIDDVGNILASNSAFLQDTTLYAQWEANNPAYYDAEGGYWYVENGMMPQEKVTDSTLISNINSSSTIGSTYYFAGLSLQSKVYGGKEYCQYNGNWYEVIPIKWRLVYSSSQTSGYGTETATLAVMAEIVYADAFSENYIGANAGYSSESVTEFKKNQIDETFLVTETKSMLTFGSTTINGTPTSVSSNIFVASTDDLSSFTTSANGTEKRGSVKFSDLVKDYLQANGKNAFYYTRDLGTNYNNIFCLNSNGDGVQYKANNIFGVQFVIKVSEYACVG